MIIDSLTHVTPDGRWFDRTYDASESRLLREMDAAGVDRAVVVALADYITNEFVLETCKKHPDRLIAGASFNPNRHASAIRARRAIRSELRDSPFRVLKLHPRLNRYDPLDPRCLAVLEELATWRAPMCVWLDTIFYFRGGVLRKPPVDAIHEIVGRFPNLTFVLLHATGTRPLQLADAIRDCDNAFVDLSLTACRYADTSVLQDLRFLASRFDQRTVIGSDFPEFVMTDVRTIFERFANGVADKKREAILGGNLLRLLATTGSRCPILA